MSYDVKIEERDEVLWVTVTGERSYDNVAAMTREIFLACLEQGRPRVLVDVRGLSGGLIPMEAYNLVVRDFAEFRQFRVVTRVAVVDRKDSEPRGRLLENLVVNRGGMLHVFSEPDAALEWLAK